MTAGRRGKVLVVSCDGGARGNPGPAGIGVSIATVSGRLVEEIAEAIGIATNNVAEYSAVLAGLRKAAELGAREVRVRSDSKLLVEQLRGAYRVRNPTLARLHGEVLTAARAFDSVAYEHVPRERNRKADRLVNEAIDRFVIEHPDAAAVPKPSQEDLFS